MRQTPQLRSSIRFTTKIGPYLRERFPKTYATCRATLDFAARSKPTAFIMICIPVDLTTMLAGDKFLHQHQDIAAALRVTIIFALPCPIWKWQSERLQAVKQARLAHRNNET